jgi:hypothetical protein
MKKNLIRAGAVTSAALVGVGLGLSGAGAAFAALPDGLTGTLAADLSSTVNVDCDSLTDWESPTVYMATGTTATVNITGTCNGSNGMYYNTNDNTATGTGGITVAGTHTDATDAGSWITAPSSFTADPNTFVEIDSSVGSDYTYISFVAVDDVPNPSGELGQTTTVTLPGTAAAASTFTVPGSQGNAHDLGGDNNCAIISGDHVYSTYTVTVGVDGQYSFRVVNTNPLTYDVVAWGNDELPIDDPYVAVYSAFDPANPDTNIVGCNDDGSAYDYPEDTGATLDHKYLVNGLYSEFQQNLAPGTYTLVLTTYQDTTVSDWNTAAYGDQSATFELWGPAGAFTLPDTGFATPSWVLPTGLGVVAFGLAIGIVSFVLRRRANA